MHENRETSSVPVEQTGRSEKALCRTADMYALEESDRCVVPMKQLNKEGQPSAEAVEGRRRPKENLHYLARVRLRAGTCVTGVERSAPILRRHYPREEPCAVIPLARICAGPVRKDRPYRDTQFVFDLRSSETCEDKAKAVASFSPWRRPVRVVRRSLVINEKA